MDFPKSIAAYRNECEAVASWLSSNGWLNQDEFDRLSRDLRRSHRKVSIHSFTGDTVIFPQGDLHIGVVQEMARAGLVDVRERAGKVEYRLKPKKP